MYGKNAKSKSKYEVTCIEQSICNEQTKYQNTFFLFEGMGLCVLGGTIGLKGLNKTTKNVYVLTYKAGAVLAECWLHIRVLCKCVNEAHLAVKQWAGFHEVVDHFLPTDLSVSGEETERVETG